MKIISIVVTLAIATSFCLADDGQEKNNIDKLSSSPPVQGGQSTGGFPVVEPPKGGTTVKVDNKVFNSVSTGKRDYFTVPEIESHIRKGDHPKKCGTNVNLRPSRATTARKSSQSRKGKEGTMPQTQPNITINMPPQKAVGIVNDPDFGGLIQADPNLAIREGASMTYSRNADGGLYYNSTPTGGSLVWLWWLLGILALVGLILGIVAMFRGGGGNGGGGNHYYNYPPAQPVPPTPVPAPAAPVVPPAPQPAPAAPAAPPQGGAPVAAPFDPAANGGGHGQNGWNVGVPVVLLMTPTGSPQQHQAPKQEPVVVNVHNHYPTTSAPKAETKKTTAKPAAEPNK